MIVAMSYFTLACMKRTKPRCWTFFNPPACDADPGGRLPAWGF